MKRMTSVCTHKDGQEVRAVSLTALLDVGLGFVAAALKGCDLETKQLAKGSNVLGEALANELFGRRGLGKDRDNE